jgi:hypothetical protein
MTSAPDQFSGGRSESFATYIYPDNWGELYLGLVEGGIRETYVREQINSLP